MWYFVLCPMAVKKRENGSGTPSCIRNWQLYGVRVFVEERKNRANRGGA